MILSDTDLTSIDVVIAVVIDFLDFRSPIVSRFRVLLLWAVSIDVDDTTTPRSGADLDRIIDGIFGINVVCTMMLHSYALSNVNPNSFLIVLNAG